MNPIFLLSEIFVLVLGAVATAYLLWRLQRLDRRLVFIREHFYARLDGLTETVEKLAENGSDDESMLEESRKRALEAERRFTEGVANILSFTYNTSGKRGE